jgi:hypothetical protein
MHPSKFLGRDTQSGAPAMSDAERADRLESLSRVIADKRKAAVDARKASGIEEVWLACEEAYLGIDDANRHEFEKARWAKPVSMSGGLSAAQAQAPDRSNAFVRLTSRYVDQASAKLGEILFPIDDKAFSFEPSPVPELAQGLNDTTPLTNAAGQPVMKPVEALPQMAPPPQFGAPSDTPNQMVQATAADAAQKIMDKAAEYAKRAETRIYDWMVEAKYPAEGRKVIHDAARIGVGVLKGPFPDVQKNRALTRNDDGVTLTFEKKVVPSVKWVDPWNVFPAEGCGEDIHAGDDFTERDFLSHKALKALAKQTELGYLPDQINKVIEEGPDKCLAEGGNPTEKKSKNRFPIWYVHSTLTRDDMALMNAVGIEDVPEDTEEVHAIVEMVNDTVIRAIINPMDSGAFPYRVMSWSRRAGHWAGEGVAEKMFMPQRAVNASTRAMFNNAGVASGVQIVLNQLGITPADGSWRITPNKLWYATGDASDVAKAFALFQIPSIQKELQSIIEYGMKLAEEQTGIPLVTQGQVGSTTPQTFGQAELQDDNSHVWLRSIGKRYDDFITEPLVNDFYEWLLLDPGVPNDEKGDYRINAQGSSAMVERAIQEATWPALLNASVNPALKINPAKVVAMWLKSKRINPRDVQFSDEEQKKMDAQPPAPPVQVMVEQVRGENALKKVAAETQSEAVLQQQELAHEQQMLQTGGTTPHAASAMAQIERERIRAVTAERVEASRAHAEGSRADKEMMIAQQNGEFKLEQLKMERELAILEYANKNQLKLQDVRAQLAQTAIQEKTKREMAAAEIELAAAEGDKDRTAATPSLIRDEVSTGVTP